MSTEKEKGLVCSETEQKQINSRRGFLQRSVIAGAVGAAGLSGLVSLGSPTAKAMSAFGGDDRDEERSDVKKRDTDILIAAEIAEALAVTTYTHIIETAPFFGRLPSDDQGYLRGARQEEMSHYLLEQSVTSQPSPFTSFFYPKGMFEDAQTTLNVLVTLEDAFIAAYLVGCGISARAICGLQPRASWGLKAITARWLECSGLTWRRKMAGRFRKSQALKEWRKALLRRTITATSGRYAGRKLIRQWQR